MSSLPLSLGQAQPSDHRPTSSTAMQFQWLNRFNHNVQVTYVFTFFFWAARSILFQQVISGYVFVLTNSNKPVGIVKGIQGISQLVFSFPAGYFADKTRRDTILKISGSLGVAGALLTAYAIQVTSINMLYVCFAIWGLFSAFQSPAMEALFADSIPHGKRSFPFMIKYNISNLAMIMGPLTSVLLFMYYGDAWQIAELRSVLFFGTILIAAASALLFQFNDDLALENEFDDLSNVEQQRRNSMTDEPLRTPTESNNEMMLETAYSDVDDDDCAPKAKSAANEQTPLLIQVQTISPTKKEESLAQPPLQHNARFLCFTSAHVPWLVFASDFIISNGAGMTINFFPLFFKEEYNLSPIQVSALFICQPVLIMVLSYYSQRLSKFVGRMPIIVVTRLLSVVCLLSMSYAQPLALQIVLFLMRGGMMRCSQPLRRSILMDHVPKELRARWNALEGLSVFSWSGSAVIGGYLIDAYDYRTCFFITSFVYIFGMAIELFLLPLTKHAVENASATTTTKKSEDADPELPKRDGSKGKIVSERAFIEFKREADAYRPALERVHDWNEINQDGRDPLERKVQAARCMDCGTPFCQTYTGCPVNNLIPEWNELVYRDEWREASDRLHKTNNFPEFTGRVCPAPCESACVAGLVDDPITIKNNEYAIVDRAWEEGWITPRHPRRLGLRVAIIGSGPAGLAAADQLNQKGYDVTVYEREDRIGGLLMYGIPNMKLDKKTVNRRVDLLKDEGIVFETNADVGVNVSIEQLRRDNDAVVLCVGSTVPRDVSAPGRELKGIHFAMEFLTKNQKRLLLTVDGKLQSGWDRQFITAEGKDVVVIGGGDTGTDCIATSMRQRCKSVINLEWNPQPPPTRAPNNPWPEYPRIYGVDYGHGEVRAVFDQDPRQYSKFTKEFKGNEKGELTHIITQLSARDPETGIISPIEGTEEEIPCDLALLAMGFSNPEQLLAQKLNLEVDQRNNIRAVHGDYKTSLEGVFAAGDCRRGQSLVVWAINEGRGVADAVEKFFLEEGYQPEVSQNQRYG
ncbi:TPA: hypothetical protein N0F65_001538 [Lagenidium giganteum]|uniref:Major facilitator superfamily (MFS) profile domain-containing protein n=1 Tax=Lagenidium giganteum TaxID=4803 RepID=A0AAV2YHP6_9STRA|nr:TPA: hypothetical protein N0F65_001538 [Lagenidium giganteum]